MTEDTERTPDATTRKTCKKLTREEARLEKVMGQLKAAAVLWVATQHDTQEARARYLQSQSAEAKRQVMLTSNREHAAHWKVLQHLQAQRDLEARIHDLRVQCGGPPPLPEDHSPVLQ